MSEVRLDRDACTGHALCYAVAPEIYDLDDEGRCLLVVERVPAEQRADAVAGAAACPERAITVVAN